MDLSNSERGNSHLHPIFQRALAPFAPPPVHIISRESTGFGLSDTTTPVCSCGWKGSAVEGWRDDQMTQIAAQEAQHRFSGVSVQQMRDGGCL